MDHQKAKRKQQLRRRHHVRRGITGTAERPRLTVFRSSKHIYAQLIDDLSGVTLASASSLTPEVKSGAAYGGNIKAARAVGKQLAAFALTKGISKAAFDRGHYKFHGRVKALAEAANEAGLKCTESRKPRPAPVEEAPKPKAEKPAKEKKVKKEKAPAPA
jgi:large subunit ribosomal protein L18